MTCCSSHARPSSLGIGALHASQCISVVGALPAASEGSGSLHVAPCQVRLLLPCTMHGARVLCMLCPGPGTKEVDTQPAQFALAGSVGAPAFQALCNHCQARSLPSTTHHSPVSESNDIRVNERDICLVLRHHFDQLVQRLGGLQVGRSGQGARHQGEARMCS